MKFLNLVELLDAIAGSSNDPFINMRLDEIEAKIDSLATLINLHDKTGTPTAQAIVATVRAELL